MEIKVIDGVSHIFLDEDEPEIIALRSIAKASFKDASLDEQLSINGPNYQMSDDEADLFIRREPRSYDGLVVEMARVDGRLCNTVLYRVGVGHFTLYDRYFEWSRGEPKKMLQDASILLQTTKGALATGRYISSGLPVA